MTTTERAHVVRAMSRDQLVAHLTIQGWVPVEGTHVALQRGAERVYLINQAKGLSVGHYTHDRDLPRREHEWDRVSDAHLRLMAERIERLNDDN